MVHQDRNKRKGHSEDVPLEEERAKRRRVGVSRGQRSRLEVASPGNTSHVCRVKPKCMICFAEGFPPHGNLLYNVIPEKTKKYLFFSFDL